MKRLKALSHRSQTDIYGEAVDLLALLHERTKDADAEVYQGLSRFDAVSPLGLDVSSI